MSNRATYSNPLDEIEIKDGTSRRYCEIIFRRSRGPFGDHTDESTKRELVRDVLDWAERAKKEIGE